MSCVCRATGRKNGINGSLSGDANLQKQEGVFLFVNFLRKNFWCGGGCDIIKVMNLKNSTLWVLMSLVLCLMFFGVVWAQKDLIWRAGNISVENTNTITFLVDTEARVFARDESEFFMNVDMLAKPRTIFGKMLFTGNIFWGRGINKRARASELGVRYPFQNLDDFEREKYTDWIADLECPITDRGHDDYAESELLKFNCDPDYLVEISKYFSAFSLGTNHTDNQGVDGFIETRENLKAHNIKFFGHFNINRTDELCSILKMKAKIGDSESVKDTSVPMAFCGINDTYTPSGEAVIEEVRKYAEVFPTIVLVHSGEEYQAHSDSRREMLFRAFIDAGAEFVIGDHPHYVQNAEVYKGKPIFYSLGNFLFDQGWNEEVKRSAMIEASFEIDESNWAWSAISEDCERGLEFCLRAMERNGLVKLTPRWKFDVLGSVVDGGVVRKVDEKNMQGILERLNWNEVRARLE